MTLTEEDSTTLLNLESVCSELKALDNSDKMQQDTHEVGKTFDCLDENVIALSERVAPLQKDLDARIDRVVSLALSLLDRFKLFDSLQHQLIDLSTEVSAEKTWEKRVKMLLKYVEYVEQLNETINLIISEEGEPVIQKLQELVEYISRTKVTLDQYETNRLTETLMALKTLYENETDAVRFEGMLDDALIFTQDQYEILLHKIKHQNDKDHSNIDENAEQDEVYYGYDLGSAIEIEALQRISVLLIANDCLDICIGIYIKVRYKKTAKTLMRPNPDYLRAYTPEEIDNMDWENLETAITLWIQHFSVAVKDVLVSEKKLCRRVFGNIMDGVIWEECFARISDDVTVVFFRFGEGVTRSSKEPQKLFKLLDIFDFLEKLQPAFAEVFREEAVADITIRFRELKKLVIRASSKVFCEFCLQIETGTDGSPQTQDVSVPKLVRYTIHYLKNLATNHHRTAMVKVLKAEQARKAGMLFVPDTDANTFNNAITKVMEALWRNVDFTRSYFKDKVLDHIFTMNTYWYIYMRIRNTELSKIVGESYMKKCKMVVQESAYLYQKQAWDPIVEILRFHEPQKQSKGTTETIVRMKLENFLTSLEEITKRNRCGAYTIADTGLREQIKEATLQFVLPPYAELLEMYSDFFFGRSFINTETLQGLVGQVFNGGDANLKRRSSKDRSSSRRHSFSVDESK